MMARVYLAARYSRFPEMQTYARALRDFGFAVTSRWIEGDHQLDDGVSMPEGEAQARGFAEDDHLDLMNADVLIAFTEPPRSTASRGGRHTEFGMALAWQKRLIVVGPRENVFHYLPEVAVYPDWPAAFAALVAGEVGR